MGKVIEFKNVYLEYPDELTETPKEVESNLGSPMDISEIDITEPIETDEEKNKKIIVENRTTKLSLEELQQKLEETQALHL